MDNREIAFLFDLDGVLIDSERKYTEIWRRVDEMYPTGVEDFPRVIKGTTLQNILDRYFDKSVHRAVAEYCMAEERKLTFDYMPGARELLIRLHDMGVPTVLVTSSDNVKMDALRAKLPDIFRWLTGIVTGEMVKQGKPAPDPYLLGASMAGVPAAKCVVVEDALTGLQSGRAAGAFLVGLTDTLGREAIEGNADIVLDALTELDFDMIPGMSGVCGKGGAL